MTDREKRYDPPECKIEDVIDKTGGDVRKLAIAYLRAQKRARDAEAAFGIMGDVNDLTLSAMTGNLKDAEKAVERAKRRVTAHKDLP